MEQKVSGAKGRQQESHFHCFKRRRQVFHPRIEFARWIGVSWKREYFPQSSFGFDLGNGADARESGGGRGLLKRWEWVRPIAVCYVQLAAVLGRLLIYRGTNPPEGPDALLEPSFENLQPRHTRIINQVWFIMMAFFFFCYVLFSFFFWQSVPAN